MVPHTLPHAHQTEDRFFVVEKPGLDVADLGGASEAITVE
jgi:hypothetical protein